MRKEFDNSDIVGTTAPVGLGHRYFLDSILSETFSLGSRKLNITVFDPSKEGTLFSKLLWFSLRKIYELGAQGEKLERLYKLMRRNSGGGGPGMFLTSLDARIALRKFKGPVLSDHVLGSVGRGFLIQGDVWGESLYAKTGVDMVFVPVDDAVKLLEKQGLSDGRVKNIGGFIVPGVLKIPKVHEERVTRLKEGRVYVSFFGTGASARSHYEYLQRKLLPGLKPLIDSGSVILNIFTGIDIKKAEKVAKQCGEMGFSFSVSRGKDIDFSNQVNIVCAGGIKDAVTSMVKVGSLTDIGIGMIGEKVGWPGTGMYFQPLRATSLNAEYNQEYLVQKGAVPPIHDAENLPEMLKEDLPRGSKKIQERIEVGRQIPIDGAQNAARTIYSSLQDSLV